MFARAAWAGDLRTLPPRNVPAVKAPNTNSRRLHMDISIAATIGFTALAVIGIIVLYAMMSKKRKIK